MILSRILDSLEKRMSLFAALSVLTSIVVPIMHLAQIG